MGTFKQLFETLIPNLIDRVEFEGNVLSIGREFLPPDALRVLDGGESTETYWEFLCDQWMQA